MEELGLNPGDVLYLTRGRPSRLLCQMAVDYAPEEERAKYYAKRATGSGSAAPAGDAAAAAAAAGGGADARSSKQSAAAGLLSLVARGGNDALPEGGKAPAAVDTHSGPPGAPQRGVVLQGWARSRWPPLVDALPEAGPLGVGLKLGSSQGLQRSLISGQPHVRRLEIDRVSAAAVLPYHADVRSQIRIQRPIVTTAICLRLEVACRDSGCISAVLPILRWARFSSVQNGFLPPMGGSCQAILSRDKVIGAKANPTKRLRIPCAGQGMRARNDCTSCLQCTL